MRPVKPLRVAILLAAAPAVAGTGCLGGDDGSARAVGTLCSTPAKAVEASRSADPPLPLRGRTVAYAREDGIYVGRLGARAGHHRITDIAGFEYQPVWSPDGRRLLLRVDGPRGGTYLVDRDGSGPRNLSLDLGVMGGSADWAPDGRRLVFVGLRENDTTPSLYIAAADGSDVCRLTDDGFEAQYPAWSPDGRRVAFARVGGRGGFDLAVIRLGDPPRITTLTEGSGQDNWPEWSPDGAQIAFSRGSHLWLMGADGSGARRLAYGGEHAWSPDGRWIGMNCPRGMCVVRSDGSDRRPLPALRDAGFIDWAP